MNHIGELGSKQDHLGRKINPGPGNGRTGTHMLIS
jgi:hypothetical protein